MAGPARAALPSAERDARLHQGEAALMHGDAQTAMQAFEQAGALGHDPVIELGLVRSAMQAGRYGQALGFAAHTAGEHARHAACLATYFWLLKLGGQDGFAQQLWASANQFQWSNTDLLLLQSVRDAWAGDWPQARGVQRQPPWRLAPHAHGHALPPGARLVGSGTLVSDDQGVQRVVVPASILSNAAHCDWWVRNGLGLTVKAKIDTLSNLVGTLRLATPMHGAVSPALRDAFPGSQAYAFAYAMGPHRSAETPSTTSETALALADWPVMKMGFAGTVDPLHGRLLGIESHQSGAWSQTDGQFNPLGGPVLDAQGRLTGVSLATGNAPDILVPASMLLAQGWSAPRPAPDQPAIRQSVDTLYEIGLTSTMQIIQAAESRGLAPVTS